MPYPQYTYEPPHATDPFGGGQTYTPPPAGTGGGVSGGEPPAKNLNLTPDDSQYVNLVSNSLHWDLIVLLGDGEVLPTDGTSIVNTIDIPGRKSVTDPQGQMLWGLTLPLMLDAWTEDLQVPSSRTKEPPKYGNIKKAKKRRKARQQWRKIRDRDKPSNVQQFQDLIVDLAQPRGRRKPPAVVRVYGKALPKHLNGEGFYITGIEWGQYLHTRGGQLRRRAVTLTLLESNPADDVKLKKHKKKDGGGKDKKKYEVKRGDTLQEIAAKFYGDASKWRRIAEANNIKNPRKLDDYVGKKIIIP